jgi:putative NADH-flavin reductase
MKITLFGATGVTGKYLIQEALKGGMEVTVFARSTSPFSHSQVRVIRGDLVDKKKLTEAIRGSDAVLSALGPPTQGRACKQGTLRNKDIGEGARTTTRTACPMKLYIIGLHFRWFANPAARSA